MGTFWFKGTKKVTKSQKQTYRSDGNVKPGITEPESISIVILMLFAPQNQNN